MFNNLKKKIPAGFKRELKKIQYFGLSCYCNVCHSNLKRFLPGGIKESIFEELDIIGAGYHEQDYCPVCYSSYRQRLVMAYMDSIKEPKPGKTMLHVAPEAGLHYVFRKKIKLGYICCDLEPERYFYYANPVKVDLTRIEFPDNNFDIVICNHVLEHIPDDQKAMSELFRVLKTGGFAIVQVPYSLILDKTYEDPKITLAEDRLKYFGQKDHVRIYGLDYFKRLEHVGFEVEIIPSTSFSLIKKYSKLILDEKEQLFIARKN